MKGIHVKKIREATGLTRAKLMEVTGISYGRLRSFETGSKDPDGAEEYLLLTALHDYKPMGKEVREQKYAEVLDDFDQEPVTLTEWRGLTPGSKVRLTTDKPGGRLREFRSYHKSPSQEYVNVGTPGKASPRMVRPDMVMVRRRGRWTPIEETS